MTAAGQSDRDVSIDVGDTFRALERDSDAVLIELTGNEDNSWAIAGDLLAEIPDFRANPDSDCPKA